MKATQHILVLGLCCSFLGRSFGQTMSGGMHHSLTLCPDSTVKAWGDNSNGQLGDGTFTASNVAQPVSGLTGVIAVSAGDHFSLALKSDGTVWAWGRNDDHGQLGNGSHVNSNVPVQVSYLSGIVAIAGGGDHAMALENDGTVWTWGLGESGQIGNGSNTDRIHPVHLGSLSGIVAITAGQWHSVALKNDGTVWAWGFNSWGQLGNGTTTSSSVPIQVNSLTGITTIASRGQHTLALKNDGTVKAWGSNNSGQIGIGNSGPVFVPAQVNGLTGVTAVAGGALHSLALKNDGTVWVWGSNWFGQLGNGTYDGGVPYPVLLNSVSDVASIAAGQYHDLSRKNDGTMNAWGWNVWGELGNGTNTDSNVPAVVAGPCQPVGVEEPPYSAISVFPNPVCDRLLIDHDQGNIESLALYDQTGREVYREADRKALTGPTITVGVSAFPTGVYMLRIQAEGHVTTKRIVVQK